jgi:thiol-disulfide isomerase/thioredoxin
MVRSTWALPVSAVFVLTTSLAAPAAAFSADRPEALPRYRFEVGQELTYKGDSDFKYGKGPKQNSMGSHTEWTVWVVRKNDDGSYRLVLRCSESSKFDGKASGEPRATLAYADVFPDGRVITNSTTRFHTNPSTLFPRLPADQRQVKNGWEDRQEEDDAHTSFQILARPTDGSAVWTFREVRKSALDEIYLTTSKSTVTFDPQRGLVTKIQSESSQGYGFNGKGTGSDEFVSATSHDAAWTSRLREQAERYFTANHDYEEKLKAASKDSDASKKLLEQATALLVAAEKAVTLPIVKEQLAALLKQHDRMASYYREAAARRAEFVGRPAAPFQVDDLKGKPHALKDYKGRVVVMDFWYRGCGWCMRAMPQMKQLEEDFRDQPVTFLGMNTDHNEADAKFVIDKMGLTYTTLKASGLPEKYGVRGFPTLVIIDKQGKVQDLYVGYSPELRKEVGEIVRGLLAKK